MGSTETEETAEVKETREQELARTHPGQDPMLIDPAGVAADRVAGSTSDAATRDANVNVADVPPNPNGLDNKPSDGGPERYPFPPGGDVDVATIPPGKGKGEFFAVPQIGDWVVLDGDHDDVPDALHGRRAAVLEIVDHDPDDKVPWSKRGEVVVRVRTRDEYNATLTIPLDATLALQKEGLDQTVRG